MDTDDDNYVYCVYCDWCYESFPEDEMTYVDEDYRVCPQCMKNIKSIREEWLIQKIEREDYRRYTCSEVQKLIDVYANKGGEVYEVLEGVLGYGVTIMMCEGMRYAVVEEEYISEHVSGHKIRFYKDLPAKYQKMLDDYFEQEA